jgi:hypothetical protein
MAAMIDVVSRPVNRIRIILPTNRSEYARYATWMPRLNEAFMGDGWFTFGVEQGASFENRDAFAWRRERLAVEVVADAAAFATDAHRDVIAAGGQVIRIEIPGSSADFDAYSIQRTDLIATLLEQVVGLQYGLVAVNRTHRPVKLDAFSPVEPGEALIVDSRDVKLRLRRSQAG